jgi:hypothetical protein
MLGEWLFDVTKHLARLWIVNLLVVEVPAPVDDPVYAHPTSRRGKLVSVLRLDRGSSLPWLSANG